MAGKGKGSQGKGRGTKKYDRNVKKYGVHGAGHQPYVGRKFTLGKSKERRNCGPDGYYRAAVEAKRKMAKILKVMRENDDYSFASPEDQRQFRVIAAKARWINERRGKAGAVAPNQMPAFNYWIRPRDEDKAEPVVYGEAEAEINRLVREQDALERQQERIIVHMEKEAMRDKARRSAFVTSYT